MDVLRERESAGLSFTKIKEETAHFVLYITSKQQLRADIFSAAY